MVLETITTLITLYLMLSLTVTMHCSQHTALLFMNLRKAFDTVSHKILLYKLHHYGICGPAYALIENYHESQLASFGGRLQIGRLSTAGRVQSFISNLTRNRRMTNTKPSGTF